MPAEKKTVLKVIILGQSSVGKTALVKQYVDKNFNNAYVATVGIDLSKIDILVNNRLISLEIWDTAGQERFQSMSVAFCRGADCCVLVYDVTDLKSFECLGSLRDEFLIQTSFSEPENFPFVVLGNKIDLPEDKVVSAKQAKEWCRTHDDLPHFEVSAKANINLDRAFQTIARKALEKYDQEFVDLFDESHKAINLTSRDLLHDKKKRLQMLTS